MRWELERSPQRTGQTRLHLQRSLWRNDTYTDQGMHVLNFPCLFLYCVSFLFSVFGVKSPNKPGWYMWWPPQIIIRPNTRLEGIRYSVIRSMIVSRRQFYVSTLRFIMWLPQEPSQKCDAWLHLVQVSIICIWNKLDLYNFLSTSYNKEKRKEKKKVYSKMIDEMGRIKRYMI